MHEIIALDPRIALRRSRLARPSFSLARIEASRFAALEKGPRKHDELRPSRPIARREAARLHPIAERTGFVDKLARRVRRVGKVRLFRLWKVFGKTQGGAVEPADANNAMTRPLAERLAWIRRQRRL